MRTPIDLVLLAGALLILALPVLARVAADAQPIAPRAGALPPLPAQPPAAALRDVPVGLRAGAPPRRMADLRASATTLLGERGAERLLANESSRIFAADRSAYPYRYPALDAALAALPVPWSRAQVAAATDLGARLTLLRQGPAAFAVLDRARAGGGCAPQLDLLLLVASDANARDEIVAAEGARAIGACPGDPTPRWLLGQFQTLRGSGFATFRALERSHPRSAAAWSGEGDAYLRSAYEATGAFVARHRYEHALLRYRRAARLQPGPEINTGIARALAGLGRPAEAAAVQARVVAARAPSASLQAALVIYLESAQRFAAAAQAAGRLSGMGRAVPRGNALFPGPPVEGPVADEDAARPVSLGAGRLVPLRVNLEGHEVSPVVPVSDVSFIPAFRPSAGVTGSDRWCPAWARRRDLILAGRPREAVAGLPRQFAPLPGHDGSCTAGSSAMLAGIAGSSASAADARQNLWRWAGDLPRAERTARDWTRNARARALPWLRLGEIEFLRRRYDDAAREFGTAARRARARAGTWSRREAEATLKRGAALLAAGRRAEGMAALRAADEIASRARGLERAGDDDAEAALIATSYYARVQTADAERERGMLRAAAEDYAAAREVQVFPDPEGVPARPEHLANNAAIVDIALGRNARAEAETRRALNADPANPAFLMTAAFAAERAGHTDAAIRLNRRALSSDPTAFPAANDLGVLLDRQGHAAAAVAALRRAVGADERYALGWFNLGVVLAGMGPHHLLASQGALARAFSLDSAFRDRERRPTLDARTYRVGLDVSRPLPAEWSFAASQRHGPTRTAGLAGLLLLAFTLSRTLATRGSGRRLAESWLAPLDRATRRVTVLRRLRHPAFAIAGTLLVFLWPLARDPGGGITGAVAGTLGLLVLLGLVIRSRAIAAQHAAEPTAQESWPLGVAFGVGAAAAGLTWAPLPVLGDRASPRLHWAAPVALAAVALPLVLLTVWSNVPLARSLAAAALVMAASLLTPIKPVDGGALAATGGTAAGLAGVGLAVLLVLGLV